MVGPTAAVAQLPAADMRSQRIASVDALRGFNIFWILGADAAAWAFRDMTKNAGQPLAALGEFVGQQFEHVPWDGFRFYDFIFPLFVFVTGASIVFSLTRLVEREGRAAALRRVFRRAVVLFALGVLFYGGLSTKWPDIRLLGVLQRIALCYLFASVLFVYLRPPGLVVTTLVLLVGYWAILTFIPVPGIGIPSYEEGVNLANWIDFHYLPGRKWVTLWDPEGLLSTLPAIATCLLGVFAGLVLRDRRLAAQQKSLALIGAGLALVAAGHLWGLQFPVIKNIWSSSFVLVAGGYSALLLGVFHQVVDVWGYRAWAGAFVWVGANAITLYFLNNVASFNVFATRFVGGDVAAWLDRHIAEGAGRFASAALGLIMAVALARFFYQRKIFLRV